MVVGRYRLESVLGEGATGVVWRAIHQASGLPVALKVLRGAPKAAAQEARGVCALAHGHVAGLYETGRVKRAVEGHPKAPQVGDCWLAYELVEGHALSELEGKLDWPALRDVLQCVLPALAHAHARDVLHLDVKPANLLVGPGGWADTRLVDFGVSASYARAERASVAGSPQFMAPEQFRTNTAAMGPWTDLYAVGAMTFQLAVGSPLVRGEHVRALAAAHADGRYERFVPRFDVPAELHRWISTLLVDRAESAARAHGALLALGEPDDRTPHGLGLTQTAPTTFSFSLDQLEEFEQAPSEEERAPLPEQWPDEAPAARVQVGPGNRGLLSAAPPIPLLGQAEQQAQLWEAFRDVHEDGARRVVWVHGPFCCNPLALCRELTIAVAELGAGRTTSWLGETSVAAVGSMLRLEQPTPARVRSRALAMGLDYDAVGLALEALASPEAWPAFLAFLEACSELRPVVVVLSSHHPALQQLLAAELSSVLWLVVSNAPPTEGEQVAVPPLDRSTLRSLLRHLLPLEPISEVALMRACGHGARAMVEEVVNAARSGRLDRSDRGHHWRAAPREDGGVAVPEALALAPSPVALPESVALELVGPERLARLIATKVIWSHEGRVCFTSDADRRATLKGDGVAEARQALVDAYARHTTSWECLAEASYQCELLGNLEASQRFAELALREARGRAHFRECEVLAMRARAGGPEAERRWQLARVNTDRAEGRIDAARVRLEAVDPMLDAMGVLELARLLVMEGGRQEVAELLESHPLPREPFLKSSWLMLLGTTYQGLGKRDAARESLERCYQAYLSHERFHGAAHAALRLARVVPAGEAERWLSVAERLGGAPSAVWDARAHLAAKRGDWATALRLHRVCLRARRNQGSVDAVTSSINVGMCLIGLGRGREAANVFRRARSEARTQGYRHVVLAARTGATVAAALADSRAATAACVQDLEQRIRGVQADEDFGRLLRMGEKICADRGWPDLAVRLQQLASIADGEPLPVG